MAAPAAPLASGAAPGCFGLTARGGLQELSDNDDDDGGENTALDEEEHVSLDELQAKVDILFDENAEAELEAGELTGHFHNKYSEAQIEAALQNLCKHGPPSGGGLHIISASSADRQVYKKAPAPAEATRPPRPRRATTTHVFLTQPDQQIWRQASADAAQGEPGWGLGRGGATEAVENLKAARIHDYFSIEYFCYAKRQWLRGILQQVEVPPSCTRFSTYWQLLNETGDTQLELAPGEDDLGGSVLDNFMDGDYRVPSEAILPH